MRPTTLVWFRRDLRLADNPALATAVSRGTVVPLFVWCPEEEGAWPPGAASRWWLHQSLQALDRSLRNCGSRLVLRKGSSAAAILEVARQTNVSAVFWNRLYEPAIRERDARLEAFIRSKGLEVQIFNSHLLVEPDNLRNSSGKPFRVFTPFWKACQTLPEPSAPLTKPRRIEAPANWLASEKLQDLELEPKVDWAAGIGAAWKPGEAGATEALRQFCKTNVASYPARRDYPGHAGTSRLSPFLHFGEIGPRQVWHAIPSAAVVGHGKKAADGYLRQLYWREFAHHLLFHFPETAIAPLRPEFGRFPWRRDTKALKAWQKACTGYPIVDAGMRELWTTGWMHNRVRMIVASFLVKDLLLSWQEGARWFWDTLVDANLANNTLGWQWAAGCGADAAPYFRIFNPVLQGEKFDADGTYVRRWIPELAALPSRWIHKPWLASREILSAAGVELGKSYPIPIVDHTAARERALAAFAAIRTGRTARTKSRGSALG